MAHVVVAVDLVEGAELVAEVAARSVGAELLLVKLPAVLALVLLTSLRRSEHALLGGLGEVSGGARAVLSAELLVAVRVLAPLVVAAVAVLNPVFAELGLVKSCCSGRIVGNHGRGKRKGLRGGHKWLAVEGRHEGCGLGSEVHRRWLEALRSELSGDEFLVESLSGVHCVSLRW